MRIIRVKVAPEVKLALKRYAKDFNVQDEGLIYDMFALIRRKGSGIPSKERIDKMVEEVVNREGKGNKLSISLAMKKRAHVFEELTKLSFFSGLCVLPDTLKATMYLLINFKKLYLKKREIECVACNLKKNCAFGQQYEDSYNTIKKVVDIDWEKKVHSACPHKPDIEAQNVLYESAKTWSAIENAPAEDKNLVENGTRQVDSDGNYLPRPLPLTEVNAEKVLPETPVPDEDLINGLFLDEGFKELDEDLLYTMGAGKVETALVLGKSVVKLHQTIIDKITSEQLAIFQLGMKLTEMLDSDKKGKFAPVVEPADERKSANIESVNEITKILPSQNALPDAVFNTKLHNKELVKNQHFKFTERKKLLYFLIDVSGSMSSSLGTSSALKLFTRSSLAGVLSIATIRRVRDDKGIVYVRAFAGSPYSLESARTPTEYEQLVNYVALMTYSGGGTNINSALKAAIKDITSSKDELAAAEILLITDGADHVSVTKNMLGKIELNVLDVSGGDQSSVNAQLKQAATRYYKVDERVLDLSKLVALV